MKFQYNQHGLMKNNLLIISDNYPPPIKGGSSTVVVNHYNLLKEYFNVQVLTTWEDLKTPCITDDIIHRCLTPKEIWKDNPDMEEIFENEKKLIQHLFDNYTPDVILNMHMWNICAETVCFLSQIDIPQIHRFGDECLKYHLFNPKNPLSNGWVKYNPDGFKLQRSFVNSIELKKRISLIFPFVDIDVIRNFVDSDCFIFQEKRLEFPLKLIYVGRFVLHKGVHICIESLWKLKNRYPNKVITLSLYGSIPKIEYYNLLKELIEKLHLEDSVIWGGNLEHCSIPGVLEKGDILLFPSLAREGNHTIEGCPNILLEAMASGIPIISTCQEGHKEILIDAKNCLIAEPDAESFSAKIVYLIENPEKLSHIVNYTIDNIKQIHSKFKYLEVLVNLVYETMNFNNNLVSQPI